MEYHLRDSGAKVLVALDSLYAAYSEKVIGFHHFDAAVALDMMEQRRRITIRDWWSSSPRFQKLRRGSSCAGSFGSALQGREGGKVERSDEQSVPVDG
ncbi:hypothetical protein [Kyrpidia tusciae]|uniref:hypothetical protein n=1 Tax=Kyrpidia tusciae TaxID=33943 RepID=UPI0002F741A9|nr:hypothetical protein [Kyrpidia tusciae]